MEYNYVLWGIVIMFLVLFLVSIVLWSVWSAQVPSVSENIHVIDAVTTDRNSATALSAIIKVKFAPGTKQGDIPTRAQSTSVLASVIADTDEYPSATSTWNLIAQGVGKKYMDEFSAINAVSVQLTPVTADANQAESAVYTRGYISPLVNVPVPSVVSTTE